MPSSKAAIVGVSETLDHWDTGAHAHASGLIHTGTDAPGGKSQGGNVPLSVDRMYCSYAKPAC